jgi:hypothetical protein
MMCGSGIAGSRVEVAADGTRAMVPTVTTVSAGVVRSIDLPGQMVVANDVEVLAGNDAWALGGRTWIASGEARHSSAIWRFDAILSITSSPDGIAWAAGEGGVVRFDGQTWMTDLSFIHHTESFAVRDIAAADGRVFAIGDYATLLERAAPDRAVEHASAIPTPPPDDHLPPESTLFLPSAINHR